MGKVSERNRRFHKKYPLEPSYGDESPNLVGSSSPEAAGLMTYVSTEARWSEKRLVSL